MHIFHRVLRRRHRTHHNLNFLMVNKVKGKRYSRAQRGFSLIELATAIAVFGALAGVVTLSIAKAQLTATSMRHERQVREAVSNYVDQISTGGYQELFDGSFDRPDACEYDATRSCTEVWGRSIEVQYEIEALDDPLGSSPDASMAVKLSGSTTVNERSIVISKTVVAPNAAWLGNDGLLRIRVAGGFEGRLYLMSASGDSIASGTSSNGRAVMRAPSSLCSSASPCRLALTPSGRWEHEGWGIDAVSAIGLAGRIELRSGAVQESAVRTFEKAPLTVLLTAENDSGAISNPRVAGSVCLWLRLHDGVSERSIPGCNNVQADRIVFERYAPLESEPTKLLLIASNTPVSIGADKSDGSCPQVNGMVVYRESGWGSGGACTSYTWGTPTEAKLNGVAVDIEKSFEYSGASDMVVNWVGPNARPASGFGPEPRWAKPRTSGSCATTESCSPVTSAPEAVECPGQHCYSSAEVAPILSAPSVGSAGVHSISISSNTSISSTLSGVSVDSNGSDTTSVSLVNSPTGLTLTYLDEDDEVQTYGNGDTLGSYTGYSGDLPITLKSESNFEYGVLRVRLTGPGGTRIVPIAVGTGRAPWAVTTVGTDIAQNSTSTIPVKVVASDGEVLAGAMVSVSGLPVNVSAVPVSSNSNGVAVITLTAAAVPVGEDYVTVTAEKNGESVSTTVRLNVTATISNISITTANVSQSGSTPIVVTATDATGSPVAGGVVELDVLDGAGPALGLRARPAGCVTGSSGSEIGTCRSSLIADAGAPTRSFTVRASAGSVTATDSSTVTPTVRRLLFTGASVRQGSTVSEVIEAVDGVGSPISGVTITVTVLQANGVTGTVNGVTGANGKSTVTFTADNDAANGSRQVKFEAGTVSVKSSISVKSTVATVTASLPNFVLGTAGQITLTARDAKGMIVPSELLFVTVPQSFYAPVSVRTDTSGVAKFSVLIPSSYIGAGGLLEIFADNVKIDEFMLTIGSNRASVTTSDSLSRLAGEQSLTLMVRDSNGAPVGGKKVVVSSSQKSFQFSPFCTSNANGECTVTVNLPRTVTEQLLRIIVNVDGVRTDSSVVVK